MPDIDFKQMIDKLKDEVIDLALSSFEKYKNEAKSDALKLLDELKGNLETWTLQLSEGKLSKTDFDFLVLGQKELIEMDALKQAGLALIKADEFKSSLLKLVTSTILGLL
jgi:hypothetical protein